MPRKSREEAALERDLKRIAAMESGELVIKPSKKSKSKAKPKPKPAPKKKAWMEKAEAEADGKGGWNFDAEMDPEIAKLLAVAETIGVDAPTASAVSSERDATPADAPPASARPADRPAQRDQHCSDAREHRFPPHDAARDGRAEQRREGPVYRRSASPSNNSGEQWREAPAFRRSASPIDLPNARRGPPRERQFARRDEALEHGAPWRRDGPPRHAPLPPPWAGSPGRGRGESVDGMRRDHLDARLPRYDSRERERMPGRGEPGRGEPGRGKPYARVPRPLPPRERERMPGAPGPRDARSMGDRRGPQMRPPEGGGGRPLRDQPMRDVRDARDARDAWGPGPRVARDGGAPPPRGFREGPPPRGPGRGGPPPPRGEREWREFDDGPRRGPPRRGEMERGPPPMDDGPRRFPLPDRRDQRPRGNGRAPPLRERGLLAAGEFYMYRYISRESCSQFDLLPLTYFRRPSAARGSDRRSERPARA